MKRLLQELLPIVACAALALPAGAQRRAAAVPHAGAKHEFGVDVGLAFVDPDPGNSRIRLGTPLDVRVGFVSRGRLMWEPRLLLSYDSEGFGNGAIYVFSPGVAGLYSMTPGGHRQGWYVTGGAGVNFVDVSGGNGGATFSIGGGVGTRRAYGDGAIRAEAGFRYDTKDSGAVPGQFSIGVRFGISLWH